MEEVLVRVCASKEWKFYAEGDNHFTLIFHKRVSLRGEKTVKKQRWWSDTSGIREGRRKARKVKECVKICLLALDIHKGVCVCKKDEKSEVIRHKSMCNVLYTIFLVCIFMMMLKKVKRIIIITWNFLLKNIFTVTRRVV